MRRDWGPARADLLAALPGWVVARVVVLGALVVANVVAVKVDRQIPGFSSRLHRGLLSWDGRWYVDIAERGYAALPDESLRFFPLYPMAGRALAPVFAGHIGAALLVVSNVGALVLGALVHRLCLVETSDEALAQRAAWLVALAPPMFVTVMGYGESLALSLAVACLWALRTRRWGWAAAAGLLAGLTRPVGLLLTLPAAIEAAKGLRAAPGRERVARAAAVVAPVVGAASFLVWVWARFGDALLPLSVQNRSYLRGGFVDPVTTVVRSTALLLEGDEGLNGMHLPWVVVFVVLTVVVCRRWPAAYGAYAVAALVLALSARNLGSFERYGFGAFPVVLALASVTARPWAERSILTTFAAAMAVYATLAFLLYYVP
ncbi:MAG: mannosyltransferase family protein [Acidimicrobiales bacterium]